MCVLVGVCVRQFVWVSACEWVGLCGHQTLIKMEHESSVNLSFFRINSSEIFGQFSRKNPY